MSASTRVGGTALEEVDIPGQSYLREALTSCIDPLKGKLY